ncbi:pilin [Halovibrio variabilis]|uniref:Pilin n=1 Tax=Halovibrio variabilis TaxID=31910 RepID=A0A511UN32_9GAMM|nr:pilin [Halovibrio variabilis]GEN26883.1 pilin [Halovibrio variabilis]
MQKSAQPATRSTKQGGFTLIELMIVVAIIGVLASIAVPQYQNYVGRAQATEAFTATAGLRTDIGLYFSENGNFIGYKNVGDDSSYITETAGDIGGQYIDDVTLDGAASGGYTVAFDNGVHSGASMVVQPLIIEDNGAEEVADSDTDGGQIAGWRCSSEDIDDTFLPSACRE